MLKNVVIALRYFLFWIAFFIIERLVFVFYNAAKMRGISAMEIFRMFVGGLRMDASAAGYICALPLLVFVVLWLGNVKKFPGILIRVYTVFMIVLCSVITVVNFNIYREWGTKINYRVLEFTFGSPGEAMASTKSSPIFFSLAVLVLLIASGLLISRYLVNYKLVKDKGFVFKLLVGVLLIGFNFLAIRGGWQLSPMNESMAYFSDKPIYNQAAVNTEWFLLRDILNSKYSNDNPYKYFKPAEARAIVKDLFSMPAGEGTKILTTDKPNVVLVIMESHTGNVVERLGGEKGVSPQMEKLIDGGVFFNNVYAASYRTDKGVIAALSAFPAQGKRSIMKESNKVEKLDALSNTFSRKGYRTSFFYGGESEFFNMRSYLINQGFQKVVDKPDFDQRDMNSKWGAYDGPVYRRMLSDLNAEKQPFFATMLTLTNHEPFELPGKPHFKGDDIENKFRSTAWYADSCLYDFIDKAKHTNWFKNTLFVVVADHGHRLPRKDLEIFDPQHYRIPLLFFGEVIRPEFRGTEISKIGNQVDIAATLLRQLNVDASPYPWSKDLLNAATPEFSFYNWDQGFGFVTKDQIVSFDAGGNRLIYEKNQNDKQATARDLRWAKACMQTVYQDYIGY